MAFTWTSAEHNETNRSISERYFEIGLTRKTEDGKAQIRNIVVNPPRFAEASRTMKTRVEFDWLSPTRDLKGTEYVPFTCDFDTPYKPTPASGVPIEMGFSFGGPLEAGDIFNATLTSENGRRGLFSYNATATDPAAVALGFAAAWNASKETPVRRLAAAAEGAKVKLTHRYGGASYSFEATTTEADGGASDGQTFVANATAMPIMEFLAKMKAQNPEIGYRYAWYRDPQFAYAFGAGAGLVVLGGVWPTLLNLMIGAGFGRPARKKENYDLDRFGNGEDVAAAAAAKEMSEADLAQLRAAELNLEKSLGAGLGAKGAPGSTDAEPEIRKLSDTPVDPQPAVAESPKDADDIEFRGEFYPTARAKKKDE